MEHPINGSDGDAGKFGYFMYGHDWHCNTFMPDQKSADNEAEDCALCKMDFYP
jgi:hypothetical protein